MDRGVQFVCCDNPHANKAIQVGYCLNSPEIEATPSESPFSHG
jgi:hypothetical protein